MENQQHAHGDLNAFEAALAGLTPRARLDRDRLMFLAGQAAAVSPAPAPDGAQSSGRHGWPAAFAAMTAIAAGLLLALLVRLPPGNEGLVERPARPDSGPAAATQRIQTAAAAGAAADSYVHLRDLVTAQGLDAWPDSAAIAAGGDRAAGPLRPSSLGALLDELQERPEASRATRPETFPESNSGPGDKS